jgi:hypothetical protein
MMAEKPTVGMGRGDMKSIRFNTPKKMRRFPKKRRNVMVNSFKGMGAMKS